MIARLTAFAFALIFSFSVFSVSAGAAEIQQIFQKDTLRQMYACDETESAKQIVLAVPLVLVSVFSAEVAKAYKPYRESMSVASTCPDFSAGYEMLVEIYLKRSGKDPELYFSTEAGKKSLAEADQAFRNLN